MNARSDSTLTLPVHARPRSSRGTDLRDIDEALWAAYRRYDPSAVMRKLVERHVRLDRKCVRSRTRERRLATK